MEENEEKNMAYEKEEENEEQENEEEEENKINENYNNNEEDEEENEDLERCEVLKGDGDKSKFNKGKKNIITEEIEEVEENMEINENTSEFPTNKSGRNKNINIGGILENKNFLENKESSLKRQENVNNINNEIQNKKEEEKIENSENINIKIINDEKKYNNFSKIEIKDLKKNKNNNNNYKNNTNNININKENQNYSFVYSNTFNKQNNEINNISIENTEENNTTNNIVNISKSNNKEKEGDINNKEIINIKNNIFMNNDDFNFNKLSDINSNIINSDINDSIEKQDFLRIMSKDIERLEKIRNNNGKIIKNETKEKEGYIYEIDNFINIIREKRKSINNDINNIIINEINYKNNNNNDYIPPKNILELNKIYKNLNNKNSTEINLESNYNNIIQKINYNKMKLPIYKSTTLQSLLNEIKKEKTYNININNININNENKIINNNFFTEKINKESNDSLNKNETEEIIYNEDNQKNNLKLFDETKFKKIKETNLRKRNKFRSEFKFKDYETNNNLNHVYLDKVKEDILMNISANKVINQNELKNKFYSKRFKYLNSNNNIDIDDSEIMPANNMKSLYSKFI